jgi:hypothetical protein
MRMFVKHNGNRELLQKIHIEYYGRADPFIDNASDETLENTYYYVFDTEDDDIGSFGVVLPDYKEYIVEEEEGVKEL